MNDQPRKSARISSLLARILAPSLSLLLLLFFPFCWLATAVFRIALADCHLFLSVFLRNGGHTVCAPRSLARVTAFKPRHTTPTTNSKGSSSSPPPSPPPPPSFYLFVLFFLHNFVFFILFLCLCSLRSGADGG